MKDLPASLAERDFIRKCEERGVVITVFIRHFLSEFFQRHNGRSLVQFRSFHIQMLEENNYLATLGETKLSISIQALPFKPNLGRQNRGEILVQMAYMPTAAKANMDFQINKLRMKNEDILQQLLRTSGVIDTRFLLIEQYEAALRIVVRVQILNDADGIIDAALPTAVVALANYKLPKFKFEDGVFKKISVEAEWPERLRIFTHAYLISFGAFEDTFVADPDEREVLYTDGLVRIGVTEKNMIYAIREDGDQIKMTKQMVIVVLK